MPTLEIILRDDAGQAIDGRSVKKYPLDCKMKTFHDIESAVETFKRNALPDIEADLLEAAQKVFIADKKKPPVNFPVMAYEFEANCKLSESFSAS